MIVQRRNDGLRLIAQHHHALAAGELAHRWRLGGDEPPGLPFLLVLTVALHDVAWKALDERPRYDPDTGRPHGFDDYPLAEKLEAYREGIGRMASVHPYAGLLGSLHYCSFLEESEAGEFLAREVERREALWREPALRGRERGAAARDLPLLQFFDGLSLRLCLAPPAVPDDALPSWLDRDAQVRAPGGRALRIAWRGEEVVGIRPFPFDAPVELALPVRDLSRSRYPDPDALAREWDRTRSGRWRLRLVPEG